MTLNEFKDIALHAAKGTAPANFTVENVNDAFIDGLKELAGSYNQFMKNRYDIYDIVMTSMTLSSSLLMRFFRKMLSMRLARLLMFSKLHRARRPCSVARKAALVPRSSSLRSV